MEPVRFSHLNELAALVKDVERFNRDFSSGGLAGKALGRSIVRNLCLADEAFEELDTKSELAEARWRADQIFQRNIKCLLALGLELIPNRESVSVKRLDLELPAEASRPVKSSPTCEPQSLQFSLIDGEKLINFLRTVAPNSISSPELVATLKFLAKSLSNQLVGEYLVQLVGERSESWQDLLDSLYGVASELNRLNQKEIAAGITVYLERAWQGDLREYLLAEHHKLLGVGFGPHNWHTDSTSKEYRQLWDKALDILEEINKNPKAAELSASLTERLSIFCENARQEISQILNSPEGQIPYHRDFGPDKLRVIESVLARLAEYS